ncbi:Retrovirus-related Pol polyprotein from transposon TNT 1-94 [Senna tora]|uniref:Retrovirus-related Pol polyprotein from transposon TNT 1-94 n=1 Tax=Senna tora TaxID=362788 RepID=A0A834U208_9FABA|nr:Retrovirus-related Pol polyprotein from transposon TNT 1-94 [Senna tora]
MADNGKTSSTGSTGGESSSTLVSLNEAALATIRGHNLYKFLIGGKHIPKKYATAEAELNDERTDEYVSWECQDQLLLSWMLNSMSENLVSKMVGCDHSYQLWTKIQENFCSSTKPRERQLRTELRNTKKGSSSMSDYLLKIKKIVDSLTAIGSPISSHDHIESIFDGLGDGYANFITSISLSKEPYTHAEVEALLLAQEVRNDAAKTDVENVSANLAQKASTPGGRGQNPNSQQNFPFNRYQNFQNAQGRGFSRGMPFNRGGRNSFQNNRGGRNAWGGSSRPQCQVCGKLGHIDVNCYNRFNQAFTTATLNQFLAQNQQKPNNVGQVEALLATPKILNDDDKVHIANGSGLPILNIGSNGLLTDSQTLHLQHILHVPEISRNLLSISKFAKDNNVFFEFHSDECFIKSQVNKQILLRGRNKQGLYLFDNLNLTHKPMSSPVYSYSATCSNSIHNQNQYTLWHNKLGHASFPVIKTVLSTCNLSNINKNVDFFCEGCCMGKLHASPFPPSPTVYSKPLELVYTDLWGPAPVTSSRAFKLFKAQAELQLQTKILALQSDFGGPAPIPTTLPTTPSTSSTTSPTTSSSVPNLPTPADNTHPMLTRSKCGVHKPKAFLAKCGMFFMACGRVLNESISFRNLPMRKSSIPIRKMQNIILNPVKYKYTLKEKSNFNVALMEAISHHNK